MILGTKYTEPRCKICNLDTRDDIEADLESGMTGVAVARKYGVSSANITSHKPHMAFSIPEKLRDIISKKVYKGDIDIESVNALIKLIQFYEDMEKDDSKVQYVTKDIGEAIAEKLNRIEGNEMAALSIPFDDFKDNLMFTNVYRRCDTCKFMIIKKGDYFNCHGQELGCGGVK